MPSEEVVIEFEEAEIEFDYEPPERATWTYPGCPASWEVISGTWLSGPMKGKPINSLLLDQVAEDVIQQIIEKAVAAEDRAISAYEYERSMGR